MNALWTGRANCFATDSIVAHYAFFSQRAYLDKTDILDRYEHVLMQCPGLASPLKALRDLVAGLEAVGDPDGGVPPMQPGIRERLKV